MNVQISKALRFLGIPLLVALMGSATVGCGAGSAEDETIASTSAELIATTLGTWDSGGGTQCTLGGITMHCCPNGQAMVGAVLNQNRFKCAPLGITGGTRSTSSSLRQGVVACPVGSVMVGYHQGLQTVGCQTLPGVARISEYTDPVPPPKFPNTPTQDGVGHVCTQTLGYTMSGISSAQNKFLCASDVVIP
jgi:hypothetical protein